MQEIIIIIVILIILYFLFWKKEVVNNVVPNEPDFNSNSKREVALIEEDENEIFIDEKGEYIIQNKIIEVPRKTYIKANLTGKYWGEFDEKFSNQFNHSAFYEFNFYEVYLNDTIYSSEKIHINEDLKIPREKLPELISTILKENGVEYEVNLHEPQFENIVINRKLHQSEGNEVFGTVEAVVVGYILDFTTEQTQDKLYIEKKADSTIILEESKPSIYKTSNPTGNTEFNGNYKRIEYYYSDFKQTYWGDWKYVAPPISNNEGCFSSIFSILTLILGIIFLIVVLPQIAILIPFLLIILLLNIIPNLIFRYFFRVLGIGLLLLFIYSLINFFIHNNSVYIPKPVMVDKPAEKIDQAELIDDSLTNYPKDTIKHLRIWSDYDGNEYEGVFYTLKQDYIKAKRFKNSISINPNQNFGYDQMVYRLKKHDETSLHGVLKLFDSIQNNKSLSKIKFAELIVSFVQDIPYALVLPDDCNPNLYDDKFIRDYLNSPNNLCVGFEKFGINSPIEFLTTLKGDCDSRTLLLYSILNHYNYDVAILSSEYYAHSVLGLNLPVNGVSVREKNKRYVMWETTSPDLKLGVLPKNISNTNYWRISLKSK